MNTTPHDRTWWSLFTSGIAILSLAVAAAADDPVSIPINAEEKPGSSWLVERALSEMTECWFNECDLPSALLHLSRMHKVGIVLDSNALVASGISPDLPVTLAVKGVTQRSALNLLLSPHGLGYFNDGTRLIVTTNLAAADVMTTRAYPVRDFVESGAKIDDLIEKIPLASGGLWQDTSIFKGHIKANTDTQSLIISQNYDVHRQIEGILIGLRRAEQDQSISPAKAESKAPRAKHPAQSNAEAIEVALRSPTSCDFDKKPLHEALDDLKKRHKIEVWIDKMALANQGISANVPITLKAREVSLQSALAQILEPLGLTYLNRDEVLKITTQRAATETTISRVYPVRDLIAVGDRNADYVSLMNVIGRKVDDKDSLVVIPFENTMSLVIRQSQHGHRETEALLTAIRKLKNLPPLPSIAVDLSDPFVLTPLELQSQE